MGRLRSFALITTALLLASCCSKGGRDGMGVMDGSETGVLPGDLAGGPLADVNFAFDSSALDAKAQSTLAKNTQWLKDNASSKVELQGHCDERGTNEYNMALGERRARSVYDYYAKSGVDKKRMSTISYGEEVALDKGHDEMAWAKNRRVHGAVK
ncbi:peptidoglycan-associated lipoprotein Pal [bacterium]|nr:peptidoglycan-associated lipoprotein Pal [bacterium]